MRKYITILTIIGLLTSCSNDAQNMGHSTPIDSTIVNGRAPATYGGKNPAGDTEQSNVNDTGTKANNVHNAGIYIKH